MGNDAPLNLVLNVILEANDGKISREDIKVDAAFELSGENMNLNFEIDSKYADLNQDFVIAAPIN